MIGALEGMAADTERTRRAAGGSVAETTVGWLGPRYLLSLRREVMSLPDGSERFALLQKTAGTAVSLQLAGVWAGRLRVEEAKLEFLRQKHQDLMELAKAAVAAKAAEAAAKQAADKLSVANGDANGTRLDPNRPMTEKELKACVDKIDEIMGLKGVRLATVSSDVGATLND